MGLDIEVYYFRSDLAHGHFPHAAIMVNGRVYGFYPQQHDRWRSAIMPVAGDLRVNWDNPLGKTDSQIIETSKEQDDLIEGILKDIIQTQDLLDSPVQYNALGNGALNCVTFIAHVLGQAGVAFPTVVLPHFVIPELRSPGITTPRFPAGRAPNAP